MVREGGLALRCGAGRLGLQASPGGLLSALGFKSPDSKKQPPQKDDCFLLVRVVIQNFLKKPVISTVFKADE